MKRLRVLGFLLLALHLGAVWSLKACFQDLQKAHAHLHDRAHQHDTHPETEQPDSFHCAKMPYLTAFNGRIVGFPTDSGSMVADTYEILISETFTPKNHFPESPPSIRSALPTYLVFSVFRI
jgi:hypothetical protein